MSEPIGEKEKITILLHEYDTLRQEIVNRMNNGFQTVVVGAALFVWAIKAELDCRFWIGASLALLTLAIAAWVTSRNIRQAAKRIREIEADVNSRAGERLLVWQARHKNNFTGSLLKEMPQTNTIPAGENKNDSPAEPSADQQSKEK